MSVPAAAAPRPPRASPAPPAAKAPGAPGALFDEDRPEQPGTGARTATAPDTETATGTPDERAQAATPEEGAQTTASRRAAAAMAMAKLRQSALGERRPPATDAPQDTPPQNASPQDTGPQGSGPQDTGIQKSALQNLAAPDAAPPAGEGAGDDSPEAEATPEIDAEIEAIRAEQLTGRQLRMAMRVAQKHGIKAATGLEAVRLLRRRGIDPFEHSTLLDIVRNKPEPGRALATVNPAPLPKTVRQPGMPAHAPAPADRSAEIARIQTDISRRRRRRLALLGARLAVFVMLPTFLAAWYFYVIATPLYATHAEFVIQQADSQSGPSSAGGLGGMFAGTGLATSQDSVTVQSYMQSREAMRRLNADHGFKAHFQADTMDPLRRLSLDTTDEAAYRLYRRMVQISYDPTEGIIKMEVIAADPETSERFSRALIQYAEEQVDQLTQRLRANQMSDAMESFERAEAQMMETQMRVLELQESYQVLSSEVEVSLLTQQITTLEGQLNQERLSLQDLLANPRPNAARVQQAERRVGALDTQIQALRSSLTQGGSAGGASLARVQRELVMAEADVATRQMMLANSLQQLEAARIEANRQVRYLSMGVSPVAPDESTYPRRMENTALALLIFAGAYLMISMTVSILREQVTS